MDGTVMTEKCFREVLILEDSQDFSLSELCAQPFVLRGANVGSCLQNWDVNFLSNVLGNEEVRVHVCNSPLMDFKKKNFLYRSLPFSDLITRASELEHSNFFINDKELYYLRSIGKNPRKDVSDFREQFPSLAKDVIFPNFIPKDSIFSSVFRLASKGISLWTHYDIMANALIQVIGKKRAVLFPPEDVSKLYLNGDKSEILDIDNPDFMKYPKFCEARRYECCLLPGDILYIPALWFHNMKYLDFGVAVNIFWKTLDDSLYDKKDPYGNKDLLPAQHAFNLLHKALTTVDQLPGIYQQFYLERLILDIQKKMCHNDEINIPK